jgi:ElaB/YqjD/DUF883 family membrane-anchored ribosome-binding protein
VSSNSPEEIRAEIERTRANLSNDVDALADQANPKNIAKRKVDDIKDKGIGLKDRIMGSATDAVDAVQDKAHDVAGRVSGHASNAGDSASGTLHNAQSSAQGVVASVGDRVSSAQGTVAQAPQAARQRTQGNPLAAGLIAFGAGWLISSLLPASQKEQQLAQQAETALRENKDMLLEPAKQAAQEIGEQLKPAAQEAVESVKATAQDAASTVKDEGQSAVQDVQGQARQSKQTVQNQATTS